MLIVVFVLPEVLHWLIYNYRSYQSNYKCYQGLLFTREKYTDILAFSQHYQFLGIVGDGVLRASTLRRSLAAHHLLTGLFGMAIIIIIIIIVFVAVVVVAVVIRLICNVLDESS